MKTKAQVTVRTLDPEGLITEEREFDSLKAAREWIKSAAMREDYWNRLAESDDFHGWAKRNVALLELRKGDDCLEDFTPAFAEARGAGYEHLGKL